MLNRKRGQGNVFRNPKKKAEMLNFRSLGYTYPQLALYYGVDHSTLIYHVKKAGLLTITQKIRHSIVRQIEAGKTPKEMAEKYKIPETNVIAYCGRAGLKGYKFVPGHRKLVIRMGINAGRGRGQKERMDHNYGHTKAYVRKPQSECMGYMSDGLGGWVREGKSYKQIMKDKKEIAKNKESGRKQQMLIY
jgi:DNA-binding CsgD family transcriptional regulator